jgi:hypothetical protein
MMPLGKRHAKKLIPFHSLSEDLTGLHILTAD